MGSSLGGFLPRVLTAPQTNHQSQRWPQLFHISRCPNGGVPVRFAFPFAHSNDSILCRNCCANWQIRKRWHLRLRSRPVQNPPTSRDNWREYWIFYTNALQNRFGSRIYARQRTSQRDRCIGCLHVTLERTSASIWKTADWTGLYASGGNGTTPSAWLRLKLDSLICQIQSTVPRFSPDDAKRISALRCEVRPHARCAA